MKIQISGEHVILHAMVWWGGGRKIARCGRVIDSTVIVRYFASSLTNPNTQTFNVPLDLKDTSCYWSWMETKWGSNGDKPPEI